MSEYLPPELVIEILKRLPVKSLLRFTCVCKFWYCLITSPSFITTHLNQTIETDEKNDCRLLLLRHYSDNEESYTVHRDDETLGNKVTEIQFPFKTPLGYFRIVGSCNGLLCLSDDLFGFANTIIIWNPSIRQSVYAPVPVKPEWPHMFVLGFGVHPLTCDPKVVRLVYYREDLRLHKLPPVVEVYTLSTGMWRRINTVVPPYCLVEFMWSQAFFNGSVHWIGYDQHVARGYRSRILLFDMVNEIFGEMMLPDALAGEIATNLSITVLEGSLAVCKHDKETATPSCCIWVMKEYGVVQSWTRLFSIDLGEGPEKILRWRKNGEVLLSMVDNLLASYDLKTLETTYLGIHGSWRSFHIDSYMESLILLKGQNRVLDGRL